MDIVEDEVHFIFECPLYDSLRQYHSSLFSAYSLSDGKHITIFFSAPTEDMMQDFMSQPNQLPY